MPGIRLERSVSRSTSSCAWCAYPVAEFQPLYTMRVGGVALNGGHCSLRCAEIEARVRGRGPLALRYL